MESSGQICTCGVFIENHNTEDTIEDRLIDTECLSATVLMNSEIDVNNLALLNNSEDVGTTQVSQDHMDFLKHF